MLAGNDDTMDLEFMIKLLEEQGMSKKDVNFFEEQIKDNTDFYDMTTGKVNYKVFLSHLQLKGYS